MAHRSEGQVLERHWKSGRGYALRFRAYGERRYLTLGLETEGWNRKRAAEELASRWASVIVAVMPGMAPLLLVGAPKTASVRWAPVYPGTEVLWENRLRIEGCVFGAGPGAFARRRGAYPLRSANLAPPPPKSEPE